MADEFGMGRLDAGKVELARGQGRQLGGRLIHHHHDEAIEPGRSTQGSRKAAVRAENPSPVRVMGNEPEWPIANRRAVPACLPQVGRLHSQKQMGRENGEISKQIGETALGLSKTYDYAR